jgi:hypothetical protein
VSARCVETQFKASSKYSGPNFVVVIVRVWFLVGWL